MTHQLADGPATCADEASRAAAARQAAGLGVIRDVVLAHAAHLDRVDAVTGSGDHGLEMGRGATAAAQAGWDALADGAGACTLLTRAGTAWAEHGGGASGALWGAALTAYGRELGDAGSATDDVVVRGVRAGLDAVTGLGRACVGDGTIVDAADPFVRSLECAAAEGLPLAPAWRTAAERATAAASATTDAGALSFALVATALGAQL